ncbi:MAG: TonB-dependent receptor, partial [Segetibacter sp.]|nr:TonB-dependent receptor [Segetibacter sp.]
MIERALQLTNVLLFIVLLNATNTVGQNVYTFRGKIIDRDTKESIKNASIIIKETKTGTATNDSGYFSITVRVPKFSVIISSIGYRNGTRLIDLLTDNNSITVTLEKRANETLDEVVVNTTREISRVKTVEMNIIKINPELIKRSPVILGEADIIKALTLQPGITTAGEGAGGFNVRGGNTDQNLVLVDGAPLFNTSHLLGFFTSVSPDAIQDVTLYKGSMPAQYGGRLSSLLNMKVKSGSSDVMRFTTGISPVSARFFANGPVIKDKLTFTAGARAAYPSLVLARLPEKFGQSRAFFYDAIIKSEYAFSNDNKISVTAYKSYDKFKFDTATRYEWSSDLLSFNGNFLLTPRLSLKLNANYSAFVSVINNLVDNYQFKLNSSIQQKQGKALLSYTINDRNKIEAGTDFILYNISPGERRPVSTSSSINPLSIQKEQGREIAIFINDEVSFTDKISLHAGIRYARYDYLGPKDVYSYKAGVPLSKETISDTTVYLKNKSIQHYGGFEPRVSLKIGVSDDMAFKLSYNRGQQFLHLISNTTGISPVDFWKISDNYIKGQKGDQYSAGFVKSFGNNQYELSVEAYYRSIKNIVDYKDGATLLLNNNIESALLNARGRGHGIEFSLSKNTGKFTGQFNYSYSKSEIQILNEFPAEQVNNGFYYPSNSDRPHNLAVITKLKIGNGWSFNCNFVLTSGRPATYPDGNYSYNGTIVTNYSKRNFDRLPLYHRLDAGFSYVSRRYAEQKRYSILNFSFYNLYARQNAYSIYFQRNREVLFPYRLSVVGT